MRTIQSKILEGIAAEVDALGLPNVEVVLKSEWSNTGALYAMEGLNVIAVASYDFQARDFFLDGSRYVYAENDPQNAARSFSCKVHDLYHGRVN